MSDPLELKHPLYMKMQPYWEFYADHYEGGPSYPGKLNPVAVTANVPATSLFREEGYFGIRLYLWQYTLETNRTYQHRLVRAMHRLVFLDVLGAPSALGVDDGRLERFAACRSSSLIFCSATACCASRVPGFGPSESVCAISSGV